MNAVVAAFNQEKALIGAFSVIVQPAVEPMDRFTALLIAVVAWRRIICIAAHCGYSMARDIAGFIECHFDEQ